MSRVVMGFMALMVLVFPLAAQEKGIFTAAGEGVRSISLDGEWRIRLQPEIKKGMGEKNGWELPDFDDADWDFFHVNRPWEEYKNNYNGVGWYRCRVVIPKDWENDAPVLFLGRPDDGGETYFNGQRLGIIKKYGEDIEYKVPRELIRFGEENVIAVRVWDWYQNGGLNSGRFAIERAAPFRQDAPGAIPAPLKLSLTESLKDGVLEKGRWEYGLRDEGTSDTRPKLAVASGAFNGADAVEFDIWQPNSAEAVDYNLRGGERGRDWQDGGYGYLSFWVRSEDTQGELQARLNQGKVRWGKGGTSFMAQVYLQPGGWQRVILPFTEFQRIQDRKVTDLLSTAGVTVLALSYGNHELQRPGKVQFANFEVAAFNDAPGARPVNLQGLWRIGADNRRPDGTESNFALIDNKEQENPRDWQGYGEELGFHMPDFDDSQWLPGGMPGTFRKSGFPARGVYWLRQRVEIPALWRGRELRLELGQSMGLVEVFVNGAKVYAAEKNDELLSILLTAEQVRFGELNSIAMKFIVSGNQGGIRESGMSIGPVNGRILVQEAGKPQGAAIPAAFEMGSKPDKPLEVVFDFYEKLTDRDDLSVNYRIVNCFHRVVVSGSASAVRDGAGNIRAVVALDEAAQRELFYGEWFRASAQLSSKEAGIVSALCWQDQRLQYQERDELALPALAETYEDTPYGKLKLVDVIDCAADPATQPQPYKEGGIGMSWVRRRAYASWEHGVTVGEFAGRNFREANNNEFFGYRVGRGKLKPHTAYLLRVLVPDDKPRYCVMNIDAGRNYQGTGYMGGVSPDDPLTHYPQTGEYQWYDHLVMNDDVTYGFNGSRKVSSENGFWVFFHDNGRVYTGQYSAGPAAAEIRLYEVENIEQHYPKINYPQNQPRRVLLMDWEREPEAPPLDVAHWAHFAGLSAIGPVFQKWASGGYWKSELGFKPPSWHSIAREGMKDEDVYDLWLAATKKTGMSIIPRVEYGGGPNLPVEARVIGRNGKIDSCGRYCSWGANILHPLVWEEFKGMVDELIGQKIKENPQITGLLWRSRQDRPKCSYGRFDVELFCKETGRQMPEGDDEKIAKWASTTMAAEYGKWWQGKRADFLRRARDLLKSYREDLVLYYYNWDADGWHLGLNKNATNTKQDWSDLYNVDKAGDFVRRRLAQRNEIPPQEYVRLISEVGEQHFRIFPELFKDDKDIVIFAPVHWRYLADNEQYINYFQTGDGLGMCNMFTYEEKARWNVQGDRYESSEMTPGGHAFGMAEEVLACFHGDPNVITWTTYTYGRGWLDVHRRFAQAFLALPDMRGTIIADALTEANPDVRVRRYETPEGTYIGVVCKSLTPVKLTLRLPVKGSAVTDLVTGQGVEATQEDGKMVFTIDSGAMQLNSYLIK